jgi:hypothetical protein
MMTVALSRKERVRRHGHQKNRRGREPAARLRSVLPASDVEDVLQ